VLFKILTIMLFIAVTVRAENIHTQKGMKLAEKSFRDFMGPEQQLRLYKETARIKEEVFKLPEPIQGDTKESKNGKKNGTSYLFISSSMPITTLRNYVHDISELNDPDISIVMRGFIGGMKKAGQTQQFMADIIKKEKNCITNCKAFSVNTIIDPILFTKFKINNVPALVHVEGEQFNVIYGDASFEYLSSKASEKK